MSLPVQLPILTGLVIATGCVEYDEVVGYEGCPNAVGTTGPVGTVGKSIRKHRCKIIMYETVENTPKIDDKPRNIPIKHKPVVKNYNNKRNANVRHK